MILTKKQNKELDSIKNRIEYVELNIKKAQTALDIAQELSDTKKVILLENAIELGCTKIQNMLEMQAKSMKLDINLVLNLVFDREYTLKQL